MADYLHAIILGLVQALTEFLPVSSSAHLLLAPRLLGTDPNSLTFDVGLHAGTLTATIAYFWRDWTAILAATLRDLSVHGLLLSHWGWQGRLGLWIVLGTIPAVAAGAAFDTTIEAYTRSASLAGVLLIVVGILIAIADRLPASLLRLESVTGRHAGLIGIAQAFALIPGVSRSGITISAARLIGFDRNTATRFSFLLSMPAITGAATLKLAEAASGEVVVAWGPMLVGAVASGFAGIAVIHWLLRHVQTHTLMPFVVYRIVLGVVVLSLAATGTI